MVSSENVNVKALHEIIFYYLSVTRDVSGNAVKRLPDVEIRRVIITDTIKWAVIDANEIEKLVDGYLEKHFHKYQNNQLIYSNSTDKFYADIRAHLEKIGVSEKLEYVFFNISDYASPKKSQYIYKILDKGYLLKSGLEYGNSVHVLNEKFYQEFLYIMGLREKAGKTSKTIEIDETVKNSLSHQVYGILKNDKEYDEITCIEKTFELIIIWMNRLLFRVEFYSNL